ncbi:MAG TPA: plastocyanin/azurin family copper-binding protein [Rhizomicrobium sp.]|jgi:plastocyanin|nr:plastocyanin/azurin family copper-binding protein [Rhizomicrobium sp.]
MSGRCVGTALVLVAALGAAHADDGHTIVQSGRAFHPLEVTIARGDTLLFSNQDEFIHQIFVKSDAMTFDSDEQPPGQSVPLKFPVAGTFEVHCHIHPKMALTVHVK